MKVKVFDEIHEKDLEDSINNFLNNLDDDKEIIDINLVFLCFQKNKFIVLALWLFIHKNKCTTKCTFIWLYFLSFV